MSPQARAAAEAKAVRETANFAMDLDELFGNEASEKTIRDTIAEVAPADLREQLAAVPFGDLRETLWRLAEQRRIERVGQAGETVPFDPARHKDITGRPPITGEPVYVLRPGTQITGGALYKPADVGRVSG